MLYPTTTNANKSPASLQKPVKWIICIIKLFSSAANRGWLPQTRRHCWRGFENWSVSPVPLSTHGTDLAVLCMYYSRDGSMKPSGELVDNTLHEYQLNIHFERVGFRVCKHAHCGKGVGMQQHEQEGNLDSQIFGHISTPSRDESSVGRESLQVRRKSSGLAWLAISHIPRLGFFSSMYEIFTD